MNSKLVKLEIVSRLTAPRCLQRYRETKAQKRPHTGEMTQIADYFCNTYTILIAFLVISSFVDKSWLDIGH